MIEDRQEVEAWLRGDDLDPNDPDLQERLDIRRAIDWYEQERDKGVLSRRADLLGKLLGLRPL